MLNELSASVKIDLETCMGEIDLKLQELSKVLRASKPTAQVYVLPLITKEDENEDNKTIAVKSVTGERAVDLAIQAYKKFIIDDNVSLKCVYRLPGFIQVKTNHELILSIVDRINSLKADFKDQVIKAGPRMVRFRLVHELFPYTNTKQIYRRINTHKDLDIHKVKFIWARKHSVKKITKIEVLTLLDEQIRERLQDETWVKNVNADIDKIKRLPDDIVLRIKRSIKEHPMIIINNDIQLQCALPLIVLQDMPFRVRELHNYDPSDSRSERSDVIISTEPIIKRMYLFDLIKTDT
ncbi:MAG: hypothetical protein HRU38_07035 [Saccharospirillaceae bacterium]|nr:hypothetical protein [Saccharospirillaceae bacterium]